ncbi:DUF4058 family protein [Microseira wollei]|uniref:DUF4058 family protein n=1 Tax=Microseira wollei NIES-4236 TaxID=2530354 RepID=A0AAV3XCZ5_9CYAN|nr:DUF4058 family protein [Microseira wollei]GET39283.1 hypothetical protein MiSe_40470 [Microseira wollei NIES-4236]
MPNPFPGMNPYLEHPEIWPEVHNRLIIALADALVPQLVPKYRVNIEKRVYQVNGDDSLLVGIPDVVVQQRLQNQTNQTNSNVAVAAPPVTPRRVRMPIPLEFRERYLEVREIATKQVVTVIEVLSPTNKRAGQGREMYEEKRQQVLGSRTHLVEIDLLRAGKPMPVLDSDIEANYRILIGRGNERPMADLYLFNLPDAIPSFPLPLRRGDVEPIVDLQTLINSIYERAGYDYVIDYNSETVPQLSESEAAWADGLLREKGLK